MNNELVFAEIFPAEAQRLAGLEETVRGLDEHVLELEAQLGTLQQEIASYRDIFAAAANGPVVRKLLASLGIQLPDSL